MMKADYKNWVPVKMIFGLFGGALACFCLQFFFGTGSWPPPGTWKIVLRILFLIGTVGFAVMGIWMFMLNRKFSYKGSRQLARQIIAGTAEYIKLPEGGRGLDVGCGSGALTIACAKRNPGAGMLGVDRWGKDYASFSKTLCESNAKAENVENVSFEKGNALKLNFEDESFDVVCSNYVYHNIPSSDRQAILLETLRVLKKGGSFAIHDIFSRAKYGDMQAFVRQLRELGYEKAELIDTTNGKFMKRTEAAWMGLSGSALLVGKK